MHTATCVIASDSPVATWTRMDRVEATYDNGRCVAKGTHVVQERRNKPAVTCLPHALVWLRHASDTAMLGEIVPYLIEEDGLC